MLDTNVQTTQPPPPSGSSYPIAYAAAWAVAVIGIISGGLAAAGLTVHPTWLTTDVTATAAIVATICVPLGALLPQLQRTPAARETKYLAATQGLLPPDIASRYPVIATSEPPLRPVPPAA